MNKGPTHARAAAVGRTVVCGRLDLGLNIPFKRLHILPIVMTVIITVHFLSYS
jgi:hypothetical protein